MNDLDAWGNVFPVLTVAGLLAIGTLMYRYIGLDGASVAMRRLAIFLLQRGLFRVPLARDVVRLNMLRVATGLIFLHRTMYTSSFVFDGPGQLSTKVFCALALLFGLLFTIGLATPLVSLVLLLTNVMIFDYALGTYSLASDVLSMLLLLFAFVPAGTRLSLDAVVVARDWPGARAMAGLYALLGTPTALRAIVAKFACLLSYSLLCLYSVSLHIEEPLWLSGDVALHILASSYLNRYFELFRELLANWEPAVWLFRVSMIVMMVWYFGFLLFTLMGGIFRKALIFWSILFFLISTFVLQLGWLGYYEFLFLAALFWDRKFMNVADHSALDVIYDDHCNLCDRTVRFLRIVDLFHVMRFRPLSRHPELVHQLNLTTTEALKDLYAVDQRTETVFHAYTFYQEVTKRILLLLPLFPILVLGRHLYVGPAVYRIIADRRIKWFGVCKLPSNSSRPSTPQNPFRALPRGGSRTAQSLFAAFFSLHLVLATYFTAALPPFPWQPTSVYLEGVAHVLGLMEINVFNKADLYMSEHWFTLHALYPDNGRERIPFTGETGERLEWHASDRVYYGNSLKWRRDVNFQSKVCYQDHDQYFLRPLFAWARSRAERPITGIEVTYYFQPIPILSATRPYIAFTDPVVSCVASFDAAGQIMKLDSRDETARPSEVSSP